jgi:hypothetical protein
LPNNEFPAARSSNLLASSWWSSSALATITDQSH